MAKFSMTKLAITLSFLSGFLSLALEVIWIRLFGFFSGGLPQVFAFTLALFLIGISIGSLVGKDICKTITDGQKLIDKIGYYLLLATAMDLFVIVSLMFVPQMAIFTFIVGLLFCAVFRGVVFPIVHHLGTEQIKTGKAISNVYFANVLGSTIAPIFVGFVLLEFLNTQQSYLLIVLMTLLVALICLKTPKLKAVTGALFVASMALLFFSEKIIHNLSLIGKPSDWKVERVIENKHGIIQEFADNSGEHIVYGGNIYDGKMNISLLTNTNQIQRAYLPLFTNTDAKRVLVVGLSTGSWAKVLTLLPNLEEMVIVELNPGYVDFAKTSPDMQDLLNDPRVKIIADDGRRYISRHPNEQYDLILMNTTFYYRNQSVSILSQQFLDMVQKQLKPDGAFMYNTTGFYHSYSTAKSVFPYVYQYDSMVVAGHEPITLPTDEELKSKFADFKWRNGNPLVRNEQELEKMIGEMKAVGLVSYDKINFKRMGVDKPEIITDENMINEYRYGYLYVLWDLMK